MREKIKIDSEHDSEHTLLSEGHRRIIAWLNGQKATEYLDPSHLVGEEAALPSAEGNTDAMAEPPPFVRDEHSPVQPIARTLSPAANSPRSVIAELVTSSVGVATATQTAAAQMV